MDLDDIEAVAYTSQVVAGTNYMVKYRAEDDDGNEIYFTAEIFESLSGDASVSSVSTEGVTADSAISTSNSSSDLSLEPEPLPVPDQILEQPDIGLIGGGEIAGGFGQEQIPTDADREFFDDEDILEQMNELIDDDLVDIEAVSFTSQVVAGTNYDVKYLATNADGEEYFL